MLRLEWLDERGVHQQADVPDAGEAEREARRLQRLGCTAIAVFQAVPEPRPTTRNPHGVLSDRDEGGMEQPWTTANLEAHTAEVLEFDRVRRHLASWARQPYHALRLHLLRRHNTALGDLYTVAHRDLVAAHDRATLPKLRDAAAVAALAQDDQEGGTA